MTMTLNLTTQTKGAKADTGGFGEDEFGNVTKALLDRHGETLLRLAAGSIEHGLEKGRALPTGTDRHPAELTETGACFVTLKREDKLRGCIGTSEARRPLVIDVADNGYRAAFKDPRFPALTDLELDELELSLSVLGPQTPMTFSGEADFHSQLRPGIDGLVIEDGAKRALFLPSVWSQLPKPQVFVEHLKVKASMAKDYWSGTFKARRFDACEISAADLPDPTSIWNRAG